MLFLLFLPILVGVLGTSDAKSFPSISFVSRSGEKSWFGWAWGAESTVSIVDRSPALSFASRPAAFGAEISNPILGYVIPLSSFTTPCNSPLDYPPNNTGCPKLCVTGPHEPERSESWIALVQRGKCEFVSKVREAQRLGARAVVVGGDDPEISGLPDTLINMFSPEDSSDVNIAATFIRYADYAHLSSLIASSNTSHSGLPTLSLLITAEYSAWEWYSPIITFVIILLLPSILTFITLFVHRMRAARAAQRDRAPEDIVHNLPCRVWNGKSWEKQPEASASQVSPSSPTDADLELGLPKPSTSEETESPDESGLELAHQQPWFDSQTECAICLCDFVKGDKVRVLPCFHIFHMDEVDEWLIQRKKLCPICKADVTHPYAHLPPPKARRDMATSPHPPAEDSPPTHHEENDESETVVDERTALLGNSSSTRDINSRYTDSQPL